MLIPGASAVQMVLNRPKSKHVTRPEADATKINDSSGERTGEDGIAIKENDRCWA